MNRTAKTNVDGLQSKSKDTCKSDNKDLPVLNLTAASNHTEPNDARTYFSETVMNVMREHQKKDEQISKAIELVNSNEIDAEKWRILPNWFVQNRYGFIVIDDILYHNKCFSPLDLPTSRMVIPKSAKDKILKSYEEIKFDRSSSRKTLAHIERYATWPKFVSDTIAYYKQMEAKQKSRKP